MDIASVIDIKPNPNIPELNAGDSVKVSIKVVEGDKERIQVFQGVVIRLRNSVGGPIVTVRRASYGVGVERAFPMNSPRVEKIELVRRGKARRARLYYLRGLSAKASRIKERREVGKETPEQTATAETVEMASTPKPD